MVNKEFCYCLAGAHPPCTEQVAIIRPIMKNLLAATASVLQTGITFAGQPMKRPDFTNISFSTSSKTHNEDLPHQLMLLPQTLPSASLIHLFYALKKHEMHQPIDYFGV